MNIDPRLFVVWVIYDHPADYPQHFVVRPQTIRDGRIECGQAQLANTLEDARKLVPKDLTWFPRAEEDDSAIVEAWI